MEQLWERGALGAGDPATLQQTVWWLISTHLGTRGHKFCFGDLLLKTTGGAEFIEFAREHSTKTRTGKMEKSTNADSRVFKPKMRATRRGVL